MFAGVRAIAVAAAMVSVSCAAVAQVVPPSDQPGRERERFERPAVPLAQPGGPAIAVPGVEAPPGAKVTKLILRRVEDRRLDRLQRRHFAALYADLIGRDVTLAGGLRPRRAASPPNTAPTAMCSRARSCRRRISTRTAPWSASRWSRAMSTRSTGRPQLSRYSDFFTDYAARIMADRPANIRTLERYLLLANDLPGLKFKNSLKPLRPSIRRRDPGRRGHGEADRRCSPASTTAAPTRAGPGSS